MKISKVIFFEVLFFISLIMFYLLSMYICLGIIHNEILSWFVACFSGQLIVAFQFIWDGIKE
jgi:hypothetical protein